MKRTLLINLSIAMVTNIGSLKDTTIDFEVLYKTGHPLMGLLCPCGPRYGGKFVCFFHLFQEFQAIDNG